MAELVLATKLAEAVVTEAVRRTSAMLVDEAAALASVSDDVEGLRAELTRIKCFLADADRKQERDKRVQNWLAEVRDVASEIEDAIEAYVSEAKSSWIGVFRGRKLRKKISSIEDKLRSIRESRQTYQIELSTAREGETCSLRNLRRSYPDDEDDDVISLKESERALKGELMREEDRRCVVSVVGMGGLGKTTLAKRVYNDSDVRRHFDCSAWVFVSQQCAAREVFSEILMQVGFQTQAEERSKFSKASLEERKNMREVLKGLEDRELLLSVKDELREKRYLIVLDDIWSVEAWYSVQSAFPKGKMGSKVVFTTRIKEVAISADPHICPIEPPLLTAEESWELLRRKAFPGESFSECDSPLLFEQLGEEMVEKCAGLPLAIVVLGGLLRTKKSLDEWKRVRKIVKSHFVGKLKSEQQYGVENILELSFKDLPYYLRPCFLYLGSFPEDCEIPKSKLIRLWIAEGFILNSEGEEAAGETFIEDVAEHYLEELIDRCVVQIGQRNHTRNGIKTCRLHDLMRDFCISKSKEEVFFESATKHDDRVNVTTRSRRIAIHGKDSLIASWTELVHPRLRSLHLSGMDSRTLSSQRNKKFVLLRVLQLDFLWGKFAYGNLPIGIGNLIHLRYLRVSGATKKFKLPHSTGNLKKLGTLDLRVNRRVLLPSTISGLINLRHLLLPYKYSRSCFGNFSFTNIETLKGIHARDFTKCTMKNIRVLKIKIECHQEFYSLIRKLGSQFVKLRSLAIVRSSRYECELPNMKSFSQCQALSRLHITWPLSPEGYSLLPKTLSKLEMHQILLNQDSFAVLAKLPNLRILRMDNDVSFEDFEYFLHIGEDKKIVFSADGFPKLEILSLEWITSFEHWEVENGSMPNLKRLDIKNMVNLAMLPEGLKYITCLKELNISGMRKAFEDRVRVGGEDFYKVCHIPAISFSDTREWR